MFGSYRVLQCSENNEIKRFLQLVYKTLFYFEAFAVAQ